MITGIEREFVQANLEGINRIIINATRNEKIPRPPAKVLDLGCGNGAVVKQFAQHGYEAYGIDINRELIIKAQEEMPAKLAWGNYLPLEQRLKTKPSPHVILRDAPDPYASIGKKPEEFDMFFVFPWPGQMHTIFEFFRQYAKKGAKLIALGCEALWEYAGDPGVTHAGTTRLPSGTYSVYKK